MILQFVHPIDAERSVEIYLVSIEIQQTMFNVQKSQIARNVISTF